jgi:hypothetical protein
MKPSLIGLSTEESFVAFDPAIANGPDAAIHL